MLEFPGEGVSLQESVISCENLRLVPICHPKDPTVLKLLWDSELLRRSVFTTPAIFTTL